MGGTDDPSNLVELTIEEHAEAHRLLWEQYGHWEDEVAWKGLSGQIGKEEILHEVYTKHSKELCQKRVEEGTHHFLDSGFQRYHALKRSKEGTHHFLGGELQRKLIEEGRNVLVGGKIHRKLVEEGVHHLLKKNAKMLECPHCGMKSIRNMKRYHFDNCKKRNIDEKAK